MPKEVVVKLVVSLIVVAILALMLILSHVAKSLPRDHRKNPHLYRLPRFLPWTLYVLSALLLLASLGLAFRPGAGFEALAPMGFGVLFMLLSWGLDRFFLDVGEQTFRIRSVFGVKTREHPYNEVTSWGIRHVNPIAKNLVLQGADGTLLADIPQRFVDTSEIESRLQSTKDNEWRAVLEAHRRAQQSGTSDERLRRLLIENLEDYRIANPDYKAPEEAPLCSLNQFFLGNADKASFAPTITPHPGPDYYFRALLDLAGVPGVEKIAVAVNSWPDTGGIDDVPGAWPKAYEVLVQFAPGALDDQAIAGRFIEWVPMGYRPKDTALYPRPDGGTTAILTWDRAPLS